MRRDVKWKRADAIALKIDDKDNKTKKISVSKQLEEDLF